MRFGQPARSGEPMSFLLASVLAAVTLVAACQVSDVGYRRSQFTPYTDTDSMGTPPKEPMLIRARTRRLLVESSGVAASVTQPGVFFTINDSGNDPMIFAVDSAGIDRGAWLVTGASNVDWEATAIGPCLAADATPVAGPPGCLYIGDTGDNGENSRTHSLYAVSEPRVQRESFLGEVPARRLRFEYEDEAHDVEAMYVASDGTTYLITKRPLKDATGLSRPALIYGIPASAWRSTERVVARLVDSLPIEPGSAPLRVITDAALAPDGRHLAVRTYAQVYIFETEPSSGRVRDGVAPGTCNVISLEERQGEGVAWLNVSGRLLLTSEGRFPALHAVTCPLPQEVAAGRR
jgi:hypothetical protein